MNIVTKSGTNNNHGSWFTLLRDDSMNARTETERRSNRDKQDYRRYQYGGSFGGPDHQEQAAVKTGACERTQQDVNKPVSTGGLFPSLDGVYATPYRETLFTGKVTATINSNSYLWLRYGRNENSQPYGAGPLVAPSGWGDSKNKFNSLNGNYNTVLGATALNEIHLPVRRFRQQHPAAQQRHARNVPERRRHRPEPEHAADDAAEEVAVPRRLLLDEVGHARHQPRVQGGRELDPRADAVHHVQHRQGRRPVPSTRTTR